MVERFPILFSLVERFPILYARAPRFPSATFTQLLLADLNLSLTAPTVKSMRAPHVAEWMVEEEEGTRKKDPSFQMPWTHRSTERKGSRTEAQKWLGSRTSQIPRMGHLKRGNSVARSGVLARNWKRRKRGDERVRERERNSAGCTKRRIGRESEFNDWVRCSAIE